MYKSKVCLCIVGRFTLLAIKYIRNRKSWKKVCRRSSVSYEGERQHISECTESLPGTGEGDIPMLPTFLHTHACSHRTGVSFGTTVQLILTAHRLFETAAAPAPCGSLAAGLLRRTRMMGITLHIPPRGHCLGKDEVEGRLLHFCRNCLAGQITGSSRNIAFVVSGAAMQMILTAYSIWKRTAAPCPRQHFAAGRTIRTAGTFITSNITILCYSCNFAIKWCASLGRVAGFSREIAFCSFWAAMLLVFTANSSWQGTTAPFPRQHFATSGTIRTAGGLITYNILSVFAQRCSFGKE